ncbi:hypothetical protein PoB_000221500 [Plakobranchus ocellatus]|uniref:Secreted protein n=1 Tax=Plakobranchus ocellatus TaxID=259542 RepID=A0AAV3XY16_9GAST|nr:hypothetical protein PoB_000221500 [Plakobranchus ocellatus]
MSKAFGHLVMGLVFVYRQSITMRSQASGCLWWGSKPRQQGPCIYQGGLAILCAIDAPTFQCTGYVVLLPWSNEQQYCECKASKEDIALHFGYGKFNARNKLTLPYPLYTLILLFPSRVRLHVPEKKFFFFHNCTVRSEAFWPAVSLLHLV